MSAKNRGAITDPLDRYYTPRTAIDAILERIQWKYIRTVLEPACGDKAISNRIRAYNRDQNLVPAVEVFDNDIDPQTVASHLDFVLPQTARKLAEEHNAAQPFSLIITNPPYTHAQAFIENAIENAKLIVMLLRLNFLGGQKRYDFWQTYSPTHLYPLSVRPSFTGQGTDATDYGWFVWANDPIFIKDLPGVHVLWGGEWEFC